MGDVFPPRSNANPRRLGPSGSSVMPGPAMKIDSSGEDDQLMSPALALPPPPAALGPSRKRKKTDDAASGEGGGGTGSGNGGGEPRRLRRSHEACARCRAKKIKVSSSHPSSILADVRRRPSVFAALTGYLRRFPAKIINRIFLYPTPATSVPLLFYPYSQRLFQCDSLHPRCGSCAAAGVVCQQEDRHRYVYHIRIR